MTSNVKEQCAPQVLPFRESGTKAPLFLAHVRRGEISCFREVAAAMGPDQPVYAICPPELDGARYFLTVEEFAEVYLRDIRKIQRSGPYFLCGYSFGGLVAYEIARMLTMQGETIGLLGLFDTPNPVLRSNLSAVESVRFRATYIVDRVKKYARNLLHGRIDNIWADIFQLVVPKIRRLTWVVARTVYCIATRPMPKAMRDDQLTYVAAWHGYHPRPYANRLVLFRAAERPVEYGSDPTLGWKASVTGGVEVHTVQGGHLTLIQMPHVRTLIDKLTPYLESSASESPAAMHEQSVEFSIVIPTYRRPKELAEALASVLRQTGVSLEVFVIDDSSEGSAKQVVEGFRDPRLTYLQNPHPSGGVPSIVRNLGWPRAAGRFVHFLDDDDIVPNGHYAAAKAAFDEHPEIGMVYGRIEPFGNGPGVQLEHERRYFAEAALKSGKCQRFGKKWAFTGQMLFGNALLVCSASVLRRECVARLGGFDPGIRLMEDAEFHVRAMREFGVHFMDRISLHYRIGSPSLMHSPNPDETQRREQREGHRLMQIRYRKERGALEFYALALFTRTILKIV